MITLLKKNKFEIVLFVLLSFVGFSVFRNFLRFSLCCDDWFLLYTVKTASNAALLLKAFTGPYGGQQFFMYAVNHFFGYNPFYYFFLSITFRILASLSVYFLSRAVIKNKTLSVFASFFFLLGNAGIETTEGVVNSINYLSLFFANLGMAVFLKNIEEIKDDKKNTHFLLSTGLISLSILTAPARASAIILVYVASEFFLVALKISKFSNAAKRISLFALILIFIVTLGFFRPEGSSAISPVASTFFLLRHPQSLLKVISFSLINFSEIIFPETFFALPNYLKIFVSIAVITASILLIFLIARRKDKDAALKIATFLVWPLIFIIVPYIYYPKEFYVTESRYIIFATPGLYLLITSGIYYFSRLINNKKQTPLIYIALTVLILINVKVDTNYIDDRLDYRDYTVVQAVYKVINAEIRDKISVNRPVVYIDSNNEDFSKYAIIYGGQERYGLTNGYLDNTEFPVFLTTFEELKKVTEDQRAASKYGMKVAKRSQIFAFKIIDRKAYSETNKTREALFKN